MSARAGDKSRFNRLRKQKIQRRSKSRELNLAGGTATKSEKAPPARKAA